MKHASPRVRPASPSARGGSQNRPVLSRKLILHVSSKNDKNCERFKVLSIVSNQTHLAQSGLKSGNFKNFCTLLAKGALQSQKGVKTNFKNLGAPHTGGVFKSRSCVAKKNVISSIFSYRQTSINNLICSVVRTNRFFHNNSQNNKAHSAALRAQNEKKKRFFLAKGAKKYNRGHAKKINKANKFTAHGPTWFNILK